MENINEPYIFKSAFVEGKTYFTLTEAEKQRIRTQPNVKADDKKYLAQLEVEINSQLSANSDVKVSDNEFDKNETEKNAIANDIQNNTESIETRDEVLTTESDPDPETDSEPIHVDSNQDDTSDKSDDNVEQLKEKIVISEEPKKAQDGTVIQAIGTTLKLRDGRIVTLSEKEIKEKPFWRKGDYYGN